MNKRGECLWDSGMLRTEMQWHIWKHFENIKCPIQMRRIIHTHFWLHAWTHLEHSLSFFHITLSISNAFPFLSPVGGHVLLWSLEELWTCLTLLGSVMTCWLSLSPSVGLFQFDSADAPNGWASETQPQYIFIELRGILRISTTWIEDYHSQCCFLIFARSCFRELCQQFWMS